MHRLLWVQVPMYSIPWSVIWRWYLIQYISRSSVYNVCDLHAWWWKGLAEIVQGFKLLSLDYQIISNVLTRMGRLAGGSCRKTNEVHGQLGIWKSMGEVRRGWGLEKSDGGVSGSIRLPDMCYNCPFCSIIIETFLYLYLIGMPLLTHTVNFFLLACEHWCLWIICLVTSGLQFLQF